MIDKKEIYRLAREAGFAMYITHYALQTKSLSAVADLVASREREQMIANGWRHCAVGQGESPTTGCV